MSGWTCITVEVEDIDEEQIAPYNRRRTLIQMAERLVGSDEPAISPQESGLEAEEMNKLLEDLEQEAKQLQNITGSVNSKKVVSNWLKEWSSGFYNNRPNSVLASDITTVEYPSRGENCRGPAEDILKECPYAKRVLVITANDTSSKGTGWLYRLNCGEVELVKEWEGYESAMGNDVVGFFVDEYGIRGKSYPE